MEKHFNSSLQLFSLIKIVISCQEIRLPDLKNLKIPTGGVSDFEIKLV